MAEKATADVSLVTRVQLARIMGKDRRTIAKWLDDGMPCAVKGRGGLPSRYSLPACVQWYIARELQANGASGGGELSPAESMARLNRKRTEELELRLQVRRGQLVEASAVVHEYADLANAVKARIRAVPDAVADQIAGLTPQEIKRVLLAKLDDALRELARGAGLLPPTEDDESDVDDPRPEARL